MLLAGFGLYFSNMSSDVSERSTYQVSNKSINNGSNTVTSFNEIFSVLYFKGLYIEGDLKNWARTQGMTDLLTKG